MKQSQNSLTQNKGFKLTEARRGLLAAVHIAAAELCIEDDDRRDIMMRMFGVASSKALSDGDLRKLLDYYASKGWKSQRSGPSASSGQATALKERAKGLLERGEQDGFVHDSRGLVKKICGVDNLEWCRDGVRLKRLLAVLESICHKDQRPEARD